jgi:hypothetical protein
MFAAFVLIKILCQSIRLLQLFVVMNYDYKSSINLIINQNARLVIEE